MQRSAVDRIGDLIAVVVYSVFMLYNLRWVSAYTYEVFWLHQSLHLLDLVLFVVVTIFIGYWWGVYLWRLFHYHTLPWFFHNLGVYLPLLFWHFEETLSYRFWSGLSVIFLWAMKHLLIVTSWVTSRAYPGRGMVFSLDFEDERDFKSMVRTAKADGLPITASKDGRPIWPEEYDVPLSQHDLLGAFDADIIRTYPPVSALGVVDATSTPTTTHEHD